MHLDIGMSVPRLSGTVPELNVADTPFDQSAGDQCLTSVDTGAVHLPNGFRLGRNVKSIRGVHLHPISQLKGLDAGFELGVVIALLLMFLVQLIEQIELLSLTLQRSVVAMNVLDELLDVRVLR